jgi:cysteine-rich repeat protein
MRNPLISSGLLALASALSFSAHSASAPDANSVLILDTTVTGGMASVEAVKAAALGKTPVVVDALTWSGMTATEFASYQALVLGDPTCGGSGGVTSPWLDAAIANRTVWGPVVTGKVSIHIGTDPVFHYTLGGKPGAGTLIENGLDLAASVPGETGLYADLSCYYHGVAPGTPVPLLDFLGVFTVTGVGCYNDAHIVATHPALAGLTDADLSNWSCSVHEAFDSFPAGFIPLAIAEGVTGAGSLSFPDETSGIPYILASGEGVAPILCGNGKIDPPSEQCDDGNTASGDGCSSLCLTEAPVNDPPDCSAAHASPSMLWPPNHKFTKVSVLGVVDPENDLLTMTITGVTQDEPLKVIGSGKTSPDAVILPDSTVNVRAERTGSAPHNGRVYKIGFTATDPSGESCANVVTVCVPHDQGNANECVDDGQLYKSTAP